MTLRRFSWAVLVALSSLAARAFAEPLAREVRCIGITVSDLDRSADFYLRVLDFERQGEIVEMEGSVLETLTGVFAAHARSARLQLGSECLELTEYLAPRGRSIPEDTRSNDHSFQHAAIIVSNMDAAYARLRAAKVEHASSSPQRLPDWNANAGGIRAFYFKDPDRHVLEVLQFPRGKGDARWQRKDALFLGIDHTAIVIGDTDASLRFYRGLLGMRVAGTSDNYGPEQEHLNGVFGAHLRITALRAAQGPGVELLEYLSPRDGRPYPEGARANDLAHWQTAIAADVGLVERALRRDHAAFLSPRPVTVARGRALLARDPDGHALLFTDETQIAEAAR